MRSNFHLPVSAVLATLVFGITAASAAGSSIQAAREAPEGTVVTVEGVVSAPSGAYSPNDEGFPIQAGKYGLYIHDALGGDYEVGDTVTVTGTVGDSFGQVWGVYPDSITVTGAHPVHPAKPTATGDVNEDTEGTLVRVSGTLVDDVVDDAPYGWFFHIDDGSGELTVFVYTGTGIDTSGLEAGDEVTITGFSGQFLSHYELNPRFQSDIVER